MLSASNFSAPKHKHIKFYASYANDIDGLLSGVVNMLLTAILAVCC